MRSRDGGDEVEESNLKFGNAKSNIQTPKSSKDDRKKRNKRMKFRISQYMYISISDRTCTSSALRPLLSATDEASGAGLGRLLPAKCC
jgi:hypothetical protein